MKTPKPPLYVILKDQAGKEVARLRTDKMNYDAATHIYAMYANRHGDLTIETEEIHDGDDASHQRATCRA